MVDVNLKVPALEKLLDYTASGIGAVAGSMLVAWRARQDAKAKLIGAQADADSLRLIADAQAEARHSLVAPDEMGRGVMDIGPDGIQQRIQFQERKRQANIKSVVQDAATELGDKEVPNHEPDPDWTARFFDCVQDVSSEDMRNLWAKILSGEVEEPGRTSLRTLDILKNMTRVDAQKFSNICDFVIHDFVFYPEEYHRRHPTLLYGNVIHLQDVGLLHTSSNLVKTLSLNQRSPVLFHHQDWALRISTTNGAKEIRIPEILLTNPGKELYQIAKCQIHTDYLRSFSSFLREENCELSYAHIITRHPDGRITHSLPFVPIEPEPEQPDGTTP
jgi:hypothetical protein